LFFVFGGGRVERGCGTGGRWLPTDWRAMAADGLAGGWLLTDPRAGGWLPMDPRAGRGRPQMTAGPTGGGMAAGLAAPQSDRRFLTAER